MARLFNVTFNARDPITLGRFWSEAIGYPMTTESPDLVRLDSGGDGPDLLLLRVGEASSSSIVHVDLAAGDPSVEVERLIALGARPVDVGERGELLARTANRIDCNVLTDPEGNAFCLGGEP